MLHQAKRPHHSNTSPAVMLLMTSADAGPIASMLRVLGQSGSPAGQPAARHAVRGVAVSCCVLLTHSNLWESFSDALNTNCSTSYGTNDGNSSGVTPLPPACGQLVLRRFVRDCNRLAYTKQAVHRLHAVAAKSCCYVCVCQVCHLLQQANFPSDIMHIHAAIS